MKNSVKVSLCLVAILGCVGTIVGVSLAEPPISTIVPRQVVLETPMSVDIPQARAEIVLPEVRIVAKVKDSTSRM